MKISRTLIHELELKGDIAKAPGNEIRINCTNCDDTRYHMYVNLKKRLYHCFKCGVKGKLLDDNEVVINIKEFNRTVDSFLYGGMNKVDIKKTIKNLPSCTNDLDSIATRYLNERGVLDFIQNQNIDVKISIDNEGKYTNTLIFPIWIDGIYHSNDPNDPTGLKYFVARRYKYSLANLAKYINAPWPKGDTLYQLEVNGSKDIVIVEGIFDALSIGAIGHNAIALLGKEITSEQLKFLAYNFRDYNFAIYLDQDAFKYAVDLTARMRILKLNTCLMSSSMDGDANEMLLSNHAELKDWLDDSFAHLHKKS